VIKNTSLLIWYFSFSNSWYTKNRSTE